MVRFILAILAGFVGAGLGLVAGWAVGAVLAEALDVSCFEGACGYFVALIALVGGGIGLVAGILIALLWTRRRTAAQEATADVVSAEAAATPATGGAGRTFGQLAGAILVIAGLVVGGVWLYVQITDDTLGGSNEATPRLHYEVRFPVGTALPDSNRDIDVQLDTTKNQAWGDLFDDWKRTDGDRPVVAGFFDLYFKTPSRILSISLPGGPAHVFILKLPSAPGHMAAYSDWYPADYVDEGTGDQAREATADDGVDIRYRVVYAGRD